MKKEGFINYPQGIEDKRKRTYVPPCRILWTNNPDTEILVNNAEIQPYIHFEAPFCILKPGDGVLLDYGREMHGGIRLVTEIPVDDNSFRGRVRIRFGESASEAMSEPNNDHSNHDSVIDLPAMGGTEFGNTGFRFVRLDIPEDAKSVKLISVPAVAIYHDLEYVGSFNSSNERLNRIWQTGAYTVHLNMQDYIYDGIKRDRLVWMGDMHPEIRVIASVFDDASLVEKSLDFLRERTKLPLTMNGISSYSSWWLICQHDWYMAKGNMEFLKNQKDYLIALLKQYAEYVDSSGCEKMPERRFLDWPSAVNEDVIHAGLQGLLAWMFKCGERLCLALGDSETASLCAGKASKMRDHVPDTYGNKSAAAMLAMGGIDSPEKINNEVLSQNPFSGVSTFYGYYVLQARALAGDIKGGMELISKYWGGMLDYGATTFWEDFDLEWLKNTSPIDELPKEGMDDLHADFGAHCYKGLRHSFCHGWAGGPTAWLTEHVLGLSPIEAGSKKVLFKPELGDLEWVEGSLPTPYGPVRCRVEKLPDGSLKTEYDAPKEVTVVNE